MKITIKNIIKENKDIDPKQKYINGIVNYIKPPYFNFLEVNEVPRELWNDIFSKLFNTKVTYSDNSIYDSNSNVIYYENSNGYWSKREYDSNDNIIYQENSDGHWVKREFDINNNRIYYEDYEGYWSKREYDSNNNVIYYEHSDGDWEKREYDENNKMIYYEDSDGKIMDKRTNNINENIDPKQKFLSLVVDNMVKQSKDNMFPFDSEKMSFNEYCKNVYGLTDDEINYVFRKYRFLMG